MKRLLYLTLLLLPLKTFCQQHTESKWDVFIDSFKTGFVDTFTINKAAFKIIAHIGEDNTDYSFELQKLNAQQWVKQFEFGDGAGMHPPYYSRHTDFNADNYNDIICYSRHGLYCFIFDPGKNEFIKSTTAFPYEWKLLDSAHNLFCSLDFNLKEDYGISLLYTFKNLQIYPYYYVRIDDSDDETKKTITLSKCVNGDTANIKRIVQTTIESDNFDFYVAFWENSYKKFMGYK